MARGQSNQAIPNALEIVVEVDRADRIQGFQAVVDDRPLFEDNRTLRRERLGSHLLAIEQLMEWEPKGALLKT